MKKEDIEYWKRVFQRMPPDELERWSKFIDKHFKSKGKEKTMNKEIGEKLSHIMKEIGESLDDAQEMVKKADEHLKKWQDVSRLVFDLGAAVQGGDIFEINDLFDKIETAMNNLREKKKAEWTTT
jgi:hypothetical protein